MSDPLTEDDLLRILKDEEADAASYYTSELADAQTKAMDRFHARPFGDEIEGRSQVVTHDIEDTINWVMPKLMRAFMSADELISVEDPSSDDTYQTSCAADYLRHILFKDNDGEDIIHDFAFDGLLQRVGVIRVAWEDPQPKPARVIEGVGLEQLIKYQSDPEYQILEQEADETGQVFSLKVQHTPKMGRCVIENIPPEEYAFSRRARSSRHADYHRWKREQFLSDLIRQFPEARDKLDPDGSGGRRDDGSDVGTDNRADARFPDEVDTLNKSSAETRGRRKVWLIEEDIRVDFDGDGITELRHVKRVGDTILENIEIERSEYHTWTPIRVAHRLAGRSLSDPIMDLQRIRTVILRNTLDSMSQSLVPRTAVNMNMADDDTIAALLDADIGGVVRVKGNVGDAIQPLVTPDLSAQGLAMLEYMDQRSEEATGVTRHAQGLRAEAITDTKGGIEALQGAANERIELIARWLAKALTEVCESVLHLVSAHQDGPRMVKIKGKPMPIDPRLWSDEMTVDVSVGMATENRQTRLMNLGVVAQKQAEILLQAGPSNPVVGLPEYRATLAMMTETMGFKAPERFFKEVPEGWQPPPPGPDPKLAEAQAKMQLEQAKAQQAAQLEEKKFAFETQMEQIRAETDRQVAALKAQNEKEIAQMRIEAETMIAAQRTMAEMQLARWKAKQEMSIAKATANAKVKTNGSASAGSGTRMGGQIG